MFKFIVRYGIDLKEMSSDHPVTVRELRRDSNLKCELGFGDSVNFLHNSVVLPDEAIIPDGAEVVVENRANSKATA